MSLPLISGLSRRLPIAVLALALAACSSDDPASPPGGGTGPLKTGRFVDHPVEGLEFNVPGESPSLTNRQGEFSYRDGQTVRFHIGDVTPGDAAGAAAVTPITLVPGATINHQKVTNISRTLITLDTDCDVNNGIQIGSVARSAGVGRTGFNAVNFDQSETAFENDQAVQDFIADAKGACAGLVSGAQARLEFQQTLDYMGSHNGQPNFLPTANAGLDIAANEGSPVALGGSASNDPEDGAALTYEWSQLAGGPTVLLTGANTATPGFSAPQVPADTALTFRLRVTDSTGATHDDDVIVTVQDIATPNQKPVASAGDDQAVNELSAVTLDGSASADSEDGAVLSYAWAQDAGDAVQVALTGADTAAPSFTAPEVAAPTLLHFSLVVRDTQNLASDPDTVTITVNDVPPGNLAPVADAGPDQNKDEGADATLDGLGSADPDGTITAYAWTQIAGPAAALTGADTATPTFTAPAVAGDQALVFRLTVTDDRSASDSDDVTVSVVDRTVVSVNSQSITEGDDGFSQMTFTVTLSSAQPQDVTVNFGTLPVTATEDVDYLKASGSHTFTPGQTEKTITVDVAGDRFDENDETFHVELSNIRGAGTGNFVGVGTIIDDDDSNLLRIGASKQSVVPSQQHIDGVDEERLGGSHKQKFNLGGFGIDVAQNFADPFSTIPQEATSTKPAGERVFTGSLGPENTNIRVMAIEQPDGELVVFAMLDAIGAGNLIQNGVKDAIIDAAAAQGVALDEAHILFGQTHSHAGADLQGLWGGVPQDWIRNTLYRAAGDAAAEALATRKPAHLSFRQGSTLDFNNYRRPRVLDANAEPDGHVSLLSARGADGTPIGSILQYNAHPTSIGDDVDPRRPHADYIQGAMDWLESADTGYGGAALYFNGPIADASPSGSRAGCDHSENDRPGAGYGGVRCRGEGLASTAQAFAPRELEPTLNAQSVEVALPVTNPLFVVAGGAGVFNRYYDFNDMATSQIPGLQDATVNLPQATPVATTLVTRLTIGGEEGGLEVVTIPGETTNTYGDYIRGLAQTDMMLLGLTQNSFGYILPEEEFNYFNASGDDGFTFPYTGYEEFVSLGPFTAPLLRIEGYNRLFPDAPEENIPAYIRACEDPASSGCILNVIGRDLDYVQSNFARQCLDQGGPPEFCALLDPHTPLAAVCMAQGFSEGFCSVFGDVTGEAAPTDADLLPVAADAQLRGCDFLDPNYCLYPFPNDYFTLSDATTDTGRRVNFNVAAMPRNVFGKPIDPTEWNRNDGFSPGALIETRIPNLSLADANYAADGLVIPHLTQMHRSLDANSAVVIIDATPGSPLFGKQHLAWAELDANTTTPGACDFARPGETAGDLAGSAEMEDFFTTLREQCQANLAAGNEASRNDPTSDPGPALLIHPGVNFEEGHRYIVALRRLRSADGQLLTPSAGFRVYRDGIASLIPQVENRRAHMNSLFSTLQNSEAGISKADLYLAWDFTVASERNLAERVLHMRNEAFANYLPTVGGVPQFTITTVDNYPLSGDDCTGSAQSGSDPGRGDSNTDNCIARRVTGTVTVPNYMDKPRVDLPENPSGLPTQYVGGRLHYDPTSGQPDAFTDTAGALPDCISGAQDGNVPGVTNCALPFAYGDGLPDRIGGEATDTFTFTCNIPRSAFNGATDPMSATVVRPARPSLYGHGLLGSQAEGRNQAQLKRFANEHNFMFCMADWIGMADSDAVNVASILVDVSNFPTLADRAQQGFLNKMFLARLMKDPRGFSTDPAFKAGESSLIDNRAVFYDGNSQGGIMGGPVVALSPDIQRGSLGVLGMNYSTLLSRSTDFAPFGAVYYSAYPRSLDQQFVFSLMQMLWDRAENNGYAQHLGDGVTADPRVGIANQPYPAVPTGTYDVSAGPFNPAIPRMAEKEVLLHPAFGDHQVTYWSAEVMGRTIGANGADFYFRNLADQDTAGGTVTHTYANRADALANRKPDAQDFFAIGDLDYSDSSAIAGSALVMWDEGKTDVPPLNNTYPNTDPYDPHEYPRRTVAARCQKARFLRTDGRVINVSGLKNDRSVACPTVDGVDNPFTGDAAPLPVGSSEPFAAPDYGTGVLGAVARFFAGMHDVITALLDGRYEDAAAQFQAGLTEFAANLAAADGLGADPQETVERTLSANREVEAVVLTGDKLAAWSVPPAVGTPYPYPSGVGGDGEDVSQGADDNLGTNFYVRDAHNGIILYPAAGSTLPPMGVDTTRIAAYKYEGGQFVEVPVQVDQRFPYFLANARSGFSFYSGTDEELTYQWDVERWGDGDPEETTANYSGARQDPVTGLDHDDEIAFMARDAGTETAPPDAMPAGTDATGGVQEIVLTDPLPNQAADGPRYIYLALKPVGQRSAFHGQSHYVNYERDADADQWIDRYFFRNQQTAEGLDPDPERLGSSNTGYGSNRSGKVQPGEGFYGNPGACSGSGAGRVCASSDRFPRDGVTVTTDSYLWRATGRWMVREISVAKPEQPGVYGTDLVDRWKGRAFQQSPDSNISVVGFEDEQVNWEANATLLGERCGPVRCMRETWGADSGTNVTKTETFYRDAVAYRYHVRVHPIPPDGLYTSWDYNRSAMISDDPDVPGGRYFTALRPQGVPIDGINDDVGQIDGFTPVAGQCPTLDGPRPPDSFGRCPAFFDAADATFNLPLAFYNWEQVSGKGDLGSLVYIFEIKGGTSLLSPLSVPYYRDDACLDDGTGDDPVQRPWPGESLSDARVQTAYARMAGKDSYADVTCAEKQGAYGSHGVHSFFTGDTDNAFLLGKPLDEIDFQQWQFMVPTAAPQNVGETYANVARTPLQALVVPRPGVPGVPSDNGGGIAALFTDFVADLGAMGEAFMDADPLGALDALRVALFNLGEALQGLLYEGDGSVTGALGQIAGASSVGEAAGGVTNSAGELLFGAELALGFKAGVGVVDMTPQVGFGAGQYADKSPDGADIADCESPDCVIEVDPYATHKSQKKSYGVQSRPTARAIVIEGSNGKRIALLKSDNYLAQDLLLRRVGQLLEQGRSGIAYEQILYGVSHAHSTSYSSALSWGVWVFQDAYDARFFEFQARKLAAAIELAAQNLQPAKMGATSIRHRIFKGNVTRPDRADDLTPAGYPLEYGDVDVAVLRFENLDGAPIAVYVNHGQHPEGTDGMDLHSADYLAPLERLVEQELGAPLVFSQGDVGSAENSGNRCQVLDPLTGAVIRDRTVSTGDNGEPTCGPATADEGVIRDWQHKEFVAMERGARFLADDIVKAWGAIGPTTGVVPLTSDVPVEYLTYWVPGPLSHPYPSVSNCRTDPTVEGDFGAPILGLPDCERPGFPGDNPASEQFTLIYNTMKQEGIPVPEHYDASAFTGVEENLRLMLQAFKLGDVLLASCACEVQNDLVLNLESRTNDVKTRANGRPDIYDGFDWACLMDDFKNEPGPNGDWAAACAHQLDYYVPDDFERGDFIDRRATNRNATAIAHMRHQVHNDARGWDAPENAAFASAEPANSVEIKGNFTKEQIQDLRMADGITPVPGFKLPITVGHAGDYNGYTVSYREYMNRDHYRKALTSYGPHTADYMATRLTRMAAVLQGAPSTVLVPEVHDPAAVADELRQEALARAHGQASSAAYEGFSAALVDDLGPVEPLAQPQDITRFGAATFHWRGGTTAADNPVVRVQRELVPGSWFDEYGMTGEVQTRVHWPLAQDLPLVYAGRFSWEWTANFEAYTAFPARLGSTPAGRYRFCVSGASRKNRASLPYAFCSQPFAVRPWNDIAVSDVSVTGGGDVAFQVPAIVYPRTIAGGPFDAFYEDNDDANLCPRCSFRPWAQVGQFERAEVQVSGRATPVPASCTLSGGVASCSADTNLAVGGTATVRAYDQDGNFGEASVPQQ